jgi:phenylalanyl-tRNA synthetase beta chain
MILSYNWLQEYIDLDESPEKLCEYLTTLGLEANIVNQMPKLYETIKIGRVVSCERHPQADKLSVCLVDIGEEEHAQIVCGAPNVAKGKYVPVALPGTKFSDDFIIKPVKLRGVKSSGMICSERELGISENHDGILELPEDAVTGWNFGEYLTGNDTAIELDITPNRPDALSHIGSARDLGSLLHKSIHIIEPTFVESQEKTSSAIKIEILDTNGCPRYASRVIKGIKISSSPEWLKKRLRTIGLRSINNVVDAANYVLMETGQPLHTFDYDKIADKKVIVRRSHQNEKFVTLDSKEHVLNDHTLLICDNKKPIAIAGVMGGMNSEVSSETVDVLIESAYFDPVTIRRGSKSLGLSTDASKRFERGVDPNGVTYALNRLTSLIQELAGGDVLNGEIDIYTSPIEPLHISFRPQRCNDLLGSDIGFDEMQAIFKGLEFSVKTDEFSWDVVVPTFRPDIEREVDLIEEVARVYGYDNIPTPQSFRVSNKPSKNSSLSIKKQIREFLSNVGFNEIYANSLVGVNEHPQMFSDEEAVILANPLTIEMASLRSSLLVGIEKIVRHNHNHREFNLRLFELGQVNKMDSESETSAKEETRLAIVLSGNWQEKHWNLDIIPNTIFNLKGLVSAVLQHITSQTPIFSVCNHKLLNDALEIKLNDIGIGYMGELNEDRKKASDIDNSVLYAELNLETIFNLAYKRNLQFEGVSAFPKIERDLSIILDQNISHKNVQDTILKQGGNSLIQSKLYDIFQGKSIAGDKKSFTFRLVFKAKDRTLTEKEVDKSFKRVLRALNEQFGATLR